VSNDFTGRDWSSLAAGRVVTGKGRGSLGRAICGAPAGRLCRRVERHFLEGWTDTGWPVGWTVGKTLWRDPTSAINPFSENPYKCICIFRIMEETRLCLVLTRLGFGVSPTAGATLSRGKVPAPGLVTNLNPRMLAQQGHLCFRAKKGKNDPLRRPEEGDQSWDPPTWDPHPLHPCTWELLSALHNSKSLNPGPF
jgi:hypothetical protein